MYTQAQTLTTGANRIDAERNSVARIDGKDGSGERVNIDIAILDTGIGPHSDLNVVGGYDCSGNGIITDVDGHGTHVAGIAAALDNGSGIVGVAPGARIWSVRVLGADLSLWSSVICGLNWVTARADTIEVVNMSLGDHYGSDPTCSSTAIHRAVCNTVAAGVTVVVAAGNYWPNGVNNSGGVPAQYNEVITVSAIADSDGKPGGLGPATSEGLDDHRANFSSWGSYVDIAAPGVDTYSLAPGGGFSVMSGTSFATPHVSGAAALYIAKHGRVGPAAVRAGLLAEREKVHIPGDPDGIDEGIVNVDDLKNGSLKLGTSTGKPQDKVTFSLSGFQSKATIDLKWDGTKVMTVTANASGAVTGNLTIPSTFKGNHVVSAISTNRLAAAPFVVSPLVMILPTAGPASGNASLTVRGAGKSEQLTVSFFNGTTAIKLASVTASSGGSASVVVKVPPAYAGTHKIEVTGNQGTKIATTYKVTPSLTVRPSSVAAGATVTATMRRFAPSAAMSLRWYDVDGGRTLVNGRTSSAGSWTVSVKIPIDATKGRHRIRALDAAGNVVTISISVSSTASANGASEATMVVVQPSSTPTAEAVTVTQIPTPSTTAGPVDEVTESPTAEAGAEEQTPTPEPTQRVTRSRETVTPTATACPQSEQVEQRDSRTKHQSGDCQRRRGR